MTIYRNTNTTGGPPRTCCQQSDSAQDRDYLSPYECGIEPPGSISHGVSYKEIELIGNLFRSISRHVFLDHSGGLNRILSSNKAYVIKCG